MNSCSDLKVSIMTEKDQGKFARKAQRILHRDQPMSLADLMSEEHEPGFPESREAGYPERQRPGYPENREKRQCGSGRVSLTRRPRGHVARVCASATAEKDCCSHRSTPGIF